MYEITFISKEEKDADVKKSIENLGGKILKEEFLGRKKLTYTIKKEDAGYYINYVFEISPEKINNLNKVILLKTQILRFLITSKKTLVEKPREIKKIFESEKKETVKIEEPKQDKDEIVETKKEPKIKTKEKVEKKKTVPEKKVEKPAEKPAKVEKAEEKTETPKKIEKVEEKKEISDEDERLKALEEKLEEILKE